MYLKRLGSHLLNLNKRTYPNIEIVSSQINLSKIVFVQKQITANAGLQYKNLNIKCKNISDQNDIVFKRTFHATKPKPALPPVVWVVLHSILKIGTVLTGRGLRMWWTKLPKNERLLIRNKVKINQRNILVGLAVVGGFVYVYYQLHLVQDPITKRKKFLLFSDKQIIQMANILSEALIENFRKQIITSGHQYNHVLRISQRILRANSSLPGTERQWQVIIIDDNKTKNALVLPSGHIFIFTGMLSAVSSDDQLAAVIAHEMAHALLGHSAEAASMFHLVEMLVLIPLFAIWTLLPDTKALFSHLFTEIVTSVIFRLPFSRSLESEADVVGLEMVARACYDPRQASVFWRKMEELGKDDQIEWLSTHPSHKTRYQTLDKHMPKAFRILISHCRKKDMDSRSFRYTSNM